MKPYRVSFQYITEGGIQVQRRNVYMKRLIACLLVCTMLLSMSAVFAASRADNQEIQKRISNLSGDIKKLLDDEKLNPVSFDTNGNLNLKDQKGNSVIMTEGFLNEFGKPIKKDDGEIHASFTSGPTSYAGRLFDLAVLAYVVYCLCNEFSSFTQDIPSASGEHYESGWYVCCDIHNGLISWR